MRKGTGEMRRRGLVQDPLDGEKGKIVQVHGFLREPRQPPNVLAMSCKARLVILALNYRMGRALAAPWRG
jgi:hypothetical protein